MLRDRLNTALKDAMRAKDARRLSTLRLILAAIKDRDIAVRSEGKDKVDDQGIINLLAKMIKQRQDSAKTYEEGGRLDLAEQERQEIEIIREFQPPQLSDAEVRAIVQKVVDELEAKSLKDIGRVMGHLNTNYAGQMDFARASGEARKLLS